MRPSVQFLSSSEAARRLGVSVKALRLYEQRGLLAPIRTAAGWRAYGPDEIKRAAEVAALRALGFSLAEVGQVLRCDDQGREPLLAAHQAALEDRLRQIGGMIEKVRRLRHDLTRGQGSNVGELAGLTPREEEIRAAFDLPWPWGGERFELGRVRLLNYIIGPLGSGKTRLARRLAETLPDAGYLGMDRLADDGAAALARLDADPALKTRVDVTLASLVQDGATVSNALVVLLAGLKAEGPAILIVDMIEQGLDGATQEALAAHLRHPRSNRRPLFVLTRSSVILDLMTVGPEETILLCPANHSPPIYVAPHPGAPGYDAVASCLASPEVRARTAGVVACRQLAAG